MANNPHESEPIRRVEGSLGSMGDTSLVDESARSAKSVDRNDQQASPKKHDRIRDAQVRRWIYSSWLIGLSIVLVAGLGSLLARVAGILSANWDSVNCFLAIAATAALVILASFSLYSLVRTQRLEIVVGFILLTALALIAYIFVAIAPRVSSPVGVIACAASIGLVAVALIMLTAILFSKTASSDDNGGENGKRFAHAWGIFIISLVFAVASFIGLLIDGGRAAPAGEISILGAFASPASPAGGEQVELTIPFRGGQPPFGYTVEFIEDGPREIEPVHGRATGDDRVIQAVADLKNVGKAKKIGIRVILSDANQNTHTFVQDDWLLIRAPQERARVTPLVPLEVPLLPRQPEFRR